MLYMFHCIETKIHAYAGGSPQRIFKTRLAFKKTQPTAKTAIIVLEEAGTSKPKSMLMQGVVLKEFSKPDWLLRKLSRRPRPPSLSSKRQVFSGK